MNKIIITIQEFCRVEDACNAYNAKKRNPRSCCGDRLSQPDEAIWCPTEGHTMWGNQICNDGDLIIEHSTKSGAKRLSHVNLILSKYRNETRITFIKKKGSRKYQFIGVYQLDVDATQNSLKTNAPACYWVRHTHLYDVK